VTPSRANYSFNPFNRSFSQISNSTEAVFTGVMQGDHANPVDTPEYFVRQQYVDVLGREPDEAGFNYWSDQILACVTMLPALVHDELPSPQHSLSSPSTRRRLIYL